MAAAPVAIASAAAANHHTDPPSEPAAAVSATSASVGVAFTMLVGSALAVSATAFEDPALDVFDRGEDLDESFGSVAAFFTTGAGGAR